MLGISKLKALTVIVITAMRSLEEVFEDSKVTFWEVLGLSPELKSLAEAFKMLPAVGAEIRDLKHSEVIEYQNFLVSELNFKKGTTHYHVSELLNSATNLYDRIVNFRKHLLGYMDDTAPAPTTNRGITATKPKPKPKPKAKPKPQPEPDEEDEEEYETEDDLGDNI